MSNNYQNNIARSASANKSFISILITAAVVVTLLALWNFSDVVLTCFAAILLATGWRGIAGALEQHAPFSADRWVTAIMIVFFGLIIGGGWWIAPNLANGVEELFKSMPAAVNRVEQAVETYPTIEQALTKILQSADTESLTNGFMQRLADLFSSAVGLVSTSFGGLVGLLVVLILAIYFASKPDLYLNGALALLPPPRRQRISELAGKIAHGLRWWLLGRLASMTVVGILTWIGLVLLEIPSALILAFIAAFLSFVPNIGPILSAIPAILVGLSASPVTALYVALLYLAIQTIESYAITPLIQQKAVTIAPALIIISQLFFGFAFGFLGLLLATPLALTAIIIIKQLYLRDYFGDQVEEIEH